MADLTFACPGCEQVIQAPEEWAGQVVECPNCNQEMTVPGNIPEDQEPLSIPDPASILPGVGEAVPAEASCPECGEDMDADAVLCMACGFHQGLGKKIDTDLA